MRITPNITINNALHNIQLSRSQLDSLQEKLASQKNYNRISDDPVTARLLVGVSDSLSNNAQYKSNITKANIWLKASSTALDGIASTMAEVKSLISTIPIDNNDATTRNNIAYQLTQMREQLADMGNTQLDNQFIFSGTATTTLPYNRNVQPQVPPPAASYQGNTNTNSVQIDANATETLNIPGSDVLGGGTPPATNVDILKELDTLIDKLKTGPVTSADRSTYANLMEQGAQQVQTAQVTVATRIKRLDLMNKMLDNTKNTLETVYGNLQNVDNYKLATQLSQQQTAFQATLSSTAKISQMSLLDYL